MAEKVERGPIWAADGAVRWRLVDLVSWIRSEYGITVPPITTNRTLKVMGYAKLLARPCHHAQNGSALEAFKKLPRHTGAAPGHAPSRYAWWTWWQDKARLGQKNKITRPLAPKDQ
ncbi:MAG: winged helix-turn-helix domain-containing protein, partial [Alphaproteobacteria bacterium]|nr:winged helix-turn-helix domain-containing protein [Alphaproteobacteria bacterium]